MKNFGRVMAHACALATISAAIAQPAPAPAPGNQHETAFDASVSSADQLLWLKELASAPNHVGSPHDKANAEFILARFKEFGWDAHIETFNVLYPTPVSTKVEMVAPERIVLGGQEPPMAGDDASNNTRDALPPYVVYQGDGDVTGDLVYVNYGMPEDYKALARQGVDVKGKIVLARYGVGWRGLKPRLAQENGAIGCIIYSDPQEDGYAKNDPYPKGGTRPPVGIQRGSVADMTLYPGDPLTPGIGATASAKRLKRADAKTILKIPVLPMSYGDALKLLQRLEGPLAPESWRGALPITYKMGGNGGVTVHLAVQSEWSLKPIHDVVAKLQGSEFPDQWVLRGNHHDAWVFGASDPLSGNVAMLSEAKALGALVKQGWRPRRTIVYLSWDAEEPMLLGSTEWAETHAEELARKAVIYVNSDTNGRGFLSAQGSHEYQHLVNAVAADVIDPRTGATVAERLRANIRVRAYDKLGRTDDAALKAAERGGDVPIGPLGSGSDFSPFLQHLGLAALSIGFGGEDESGGVYHSVYDSYHHFTTFDDPGLQYGAALSKTIGRVVLRIAAADLPVTRYADFADTVAVYLTEVKKLADDRREEDRKRDKLLEDGAFRLASDPRKPVGAPAVESRTPHLDLAVLEDAVEELQLAATRFDKAVAARGAALTPARKATLAAQLRDIAQLLLDARGLPGRPWYRNLVYAPGRLTGYGAKTLPAVREAIEERRFDEVGEYSRRTAQVLRAYAARLDVARGTVEAP